MNGPQWRYSIHSWEASLKPPLTFSLFNLPFDHKLHVFGTKIFHGHEQASAVSWYLFYCDFTLYILCNGMKSKCYSVWVSVCSCVSVFVHCAVRGGQVVEICSAHINCCNAAAVLFFLILFHFGDVTWKWALIKCLLCFRFETNSCQLCAGVQIALFSEITIKGYSYEWSHKSGAWSQQKLVFAHYRHCKQEQLMKGRQDKKACSFLASAISAFAHHLACCFCIHPLLRHSCSDLVFFVFAFSIQNLS